MFWGLIMEPNKRYTQVVEKPFHISQAAMDISTGDNDPCQVMVVVDGKNFLVCTLQKNKCIQVPLDLYFKMGDSVAFLTNGKCNVHLTGYLDPEFEEEQSDEEEEAESEEEEEAPAPVSSKNKRKQLDSSTESSSNKKAKKEKKGKKAAEESSDSDEEEDDLQKFLDGEIDTDENDESFKVNTSAEADDSEEDSDEEEEEEEEGEEDDEDDDENDKGESSEADTTLDTSKDESKVDMSKLTKNQRKRLRKKLQQAKTPQVNGVEKTKEKPEAPQKAEKKKAEPKKEEEKGDKREKKNLSGGVAIEDLKVGTGAVAKPGKVVTVYYEGRLKQNNKMFDNCLKGPGFKFRLGAKEVIKGWDVGVAGMKVGGKRKIVCPPAMAYGANGSLPVIPPNSTLTFEVELKNVK
ncbi:PREDICTED: 46 kDa FK506-binding nuclear protein [Papilio polytes]|uniref:46 kDa FK506-binding nuclear protein n=1 Tax=Papilio polytes TaxID=76194 RepID=UPI0006766792|nr:PREDICTED: 46 kDa FK506-binding nuclear protein [Papilio polytes]